MTGYTLAGPDIGVVRCDLADLYNQLGEDEGLAAAQNATDLPTLLPGQNPPRVIRIYRGGDESLSWEWFQRKAAANPPQPVHEPTAADLERRAEREMLRSNTLQENQAAGITFDHPGELLNRVRNNNADVAIWHQPARFKIEVDVSLMVRAPTPALAKDAAAAYFANKPLPPETDVHFVPTEAAENAMRALAQEGTFEKAEWAGSVNGGAERLMAPTVKKLLHMLMRHEDERFREQAIQQAEGIDALIAVMSRGG